MRAGCVRRLAQIGLEGNANKFFVFGTFMMLTNMAATSLAIMVRVGLCVCGAVCVCVCVC